MYKIALVLIIYFASFSLLPPIAIADDQPNDTASKSEPKNRCFRVYDINGFQYIDDYHALLSGRTSKENFLIRFNRRCTDLKFTSRITTTFENSLVCKPIIESIHTSNDRCPVDMIEKVANKEAAKQIVDERAKTRQEKAEARKAKSKSLD